MPLQLEGDKAAAPPMAEIAVSAVVDKADKLLAVDKKILIIASGSRGDIQPFCATAISLMRRGMKVGIVTNVEHEALVKSVPGIEYFNNSTNFEDFFTGKLPDFNPFKAIRDMKISEFHRIYFTWKATIGYFEMKEILKAIDAYKPNAILCCGPVHDEMTGWVPRVTRIPVLQAALMPFHFCRWDAPFAGVPKVPCGQNMRYTKWLERTRIDVLIKSYSFAIYQHTGIDYNKWYPRECEELIPWGAGTPAQRAKSDDVLVLTWPEFHRKSTDPSTMLYVGYPFISAEHITSKSLEWGGEDTEKLEAFLAAGSIPAYIGYGSMKMELPEVVTTKVVTAAKIAECRAVILGGYGGLSFDAIEDPELKAYAEKNIIFVKKADHVTLFPQCSVAVHHAGHGTALAAPRGGLPSVVTPTHFDQQSNGQMLQRNGLGVCLKPFSRSTAEQIGRAVRKVINDPVMSERCKNAARMIAQNDGQENIGNYIKKWMEEMVLTGLQMKKNDEYWQEILERKAREHNQPNFCGCCRSFLRPF